MRHLIVASATVVATVFAAPSHAQAQELGRIDFPTSGSPQAQRHFLRGAAMLHSFGFEDAAEEFKKAQALDPDFAMAYWGEALSYNHPLQRLQVLELPRQALARLGSTRAARLAKAPTAREKGFLEAVEILFGEGEESDRRAAYAEAMGRLADRYPDDHEVLAFYAVSLLGAVRDIGHERYRTENRAGAIALRIFDENPNHPGAPHYIIHAFDDPIHAPLALPAAKRYAQIAPAVVHALHMPSHIFIQLGMWDDVSTRNDASYAAAAKLWADRDSFSDTKKYFNARNLTHALDWGQYGDLQRGAYDKARRAIELGQIVLEAGDTPIANRRASLLLPRYVIETQQWQDVPISEHSPEASLLAAGMSAARTGDLAAAERAAAGLKERATQGSTAIAVAHGEVEALILVARGRAEEAIALMDETIEKAESMGTPRGAPTPLKPAHELYGEILLELDRPKEAAEQFEKSLLRTPNRALSLLGLARAAARSGDRVTAREQYDKLMAIWREHSDLPGFQEAYRFVNESQEP